MNSSNILLIILLCFVLIFSFLLRTSIHLQTLQIIANHTTNEQFNDYLVARILSPFLILTILCIFFILRKK